MGKNSMGGYTLRHDKLRLLGFPEGNVWKAMPLIVAAHSCPPTVQKFFESKFAEQRFRSQHVFCN